MKEFVSSLDATQKKALGDYFVKGLASSKVSGEDYSVDDAMHEAVSMLLLDALSGDDSEGYYEYISQTARQIIEGVYESLAEVRGEFDGLVKEFNQEIGE